MRRLLALLLLLATLAQAFSANEPGLTLEQTISLLRQGGFVIYFRHGETGSHVPDRSPDLADCGAQRNLNDRGQCEAQEISRAFMARPAIGSQLSERVIHPLQAAESPPRRGSAGARAAGRRWCASRARRRRGRRRGTSPAAAD
jgi:hypothetical protein